MRLLSFLIAVNMLLCYSTVCKSADLSGDDAPAASSHCDMKGRDSGKSVMAMLRVSAPQSAPAGESPCCLDTLRNASPLDNLTGAAIVTSIADYRDPQPARMQHNVYPSAVHSAHGPPLIYLSVSRLLL